MANLPIVYGLYPVHCAFLLSLSWIFNVWNAVWKNNFIQSPFMRCVYGNFFYAFLWLVESARITFNAKQHFFRTVLLVCIFYSLVGLFFIKEHVIISLSILAFVHQFNWIHTETPLSDSWVRDMKQEMVGTFFVIFFYSSSLSVIHSSVVVSLNVLYWKWNHWMAFIDWCSSMFYVNVFLLIKSKAINFIITILRLSLSIIGIATNTKIHRYD